MRKYIIVLLAVLFCPKDMYGQTGIVDGKKVSASIPALAHIDSLTLKEKKKYVAGYNRKEQQLVMQIRKADSLYKLDPKSDATAAAIKAGRTAKQELTAYEQQTDQHLRNYREKLRKPYTDKMEKAIRLILQRHNLKQVYDVTEKLPANAGKTYDITAEVIAELKKK